MDVNQRQFPVWQKFLSSCSEAYKSIKLRSCYYDEIIVTTIQEVALFKANILFCKWATMSYKPFLQFVSSKPWMCFENTNWRKAQVLKLFRLKVKREKSQRNEKSSEWDTDTMGSRVMPSGVGPLNNSLSHPITPKLPHLYPLHTSPPPLPLLPLCSVGVTPLVAPQWHHRYLFMGEWWEGETEGVAGRS